MKKLPDLSRYLTATFRPFSELTRGFAPPVISKRMADQQAVFTIQGNPLRDIHTVAKVRLHSLDFAPADRREILIDLFRLGISASALFRDLPGVAETLRWIHEDYIPRMNATRDAVD